MPPLQRLIEIFEKCLIGGYMKLPLFAKNSGYARSAQTSPSRRENERPLKNALFCLRQRTLADQAQIFTLKILNVCLPAPLAP